MGSAEVSRVWTGAWSAAGSRSISCQLFRACEAPKLATHFQRNVPPRQINLPACDKQRRYLPFLFLAQEFPRSPVVPRYAPSLTLPRILRPPPRPRQRRQNHASRADKSVLHALAPQSEDRPDRRAKHRNARAPPSKPANLPQAMGRRRSAQPPRAVDKLLQRRTRNRVCVG
jgi:hypothetical protein